MTLMLDDKDEKVADVYNRSIPAAIVDGLLGVAAHGSEKFMRSKQPNGVYATATVARHYDALVEIEWTFSSTLNRNAGCDCSWTHCASDDSDTYNWKPRKRRHARTSTRRR